LLSGIVLDAGDWDVAGTLQLLISETNARTARCFQYVNPAEVWTAAPDDSCDVSTVSLPTGDACELVGVDVADDTGVLEVRLRFACSSGVGGGLAIALERDGPGPAYDGLSRWMCAVMLDLCMGPKKSAHQEPAHLAAGAATMQINAQLTPVVGAEGESGRCRLMHGDLEEVPVPEADSNGACEVACLGRADLIQGGVALHRNRACIGYSFAVSSDTPLAARCILAIATSNEAKSMDHLRVEKAVDVQWTCIAIEPNEAQVQSSDPTVEEAHMVYDVEATLPLLPLSNAQLYGQHIAQVPDVGRKLANEPCFPPTFWFNFMQPLSITSDEYEMIMANLPPKAAAVQPIRVQVSLSRACLCVEDVCTACEKRNPDQSFALFMHKLVIVALVLLMTYLWYLLNQKPDPPPPSAPEPEPERKPVEITAVLTYDPTTGAEVRHAYDHSIPMILSGQAVPPVYSSGASGHNYAALPSEDPYHG
jgi:hypothetical protein